MKDLKFLSIFIIFISFTFSKETITWYKSPFPPFFIIEGTYKNMGTDDLIIDYYQKKLDSYNHVTEIVTISRLLGIAREVNNFCSGNLIKTTEREEFLYFSEPYDFILPNHLIIKKDNLKLFQPYIDDKGLISIEQLLKNDNITLGLVKDRVYAPSLTPLLLSSKNIDFTIGLSDQETILKKLSSNRVSATIEYPAVVEFTLKDNKMSLDYIAIPIKGLDSYTPVRFSFPKNKWGKDMVEKINPLISDFIKTKEFETLTLKWHPEKYKYIKQFRERINW